MKWVVGSLPENSQWHWRIIESRQLWAQPNSWWTSGVLHGPPPKQKTALQRTTQLSSVHLLQPITIQLIVTELQKAVPVITAQSYKLEQYGAAESCSTKHSHNNISWCCCAWYAIQRLSWAPRPLKSADCGDAKVRPYNLILLVYSENRASLLNPPKNLNNLKTKAKEG